MPSPILTDGATFTCAHKGVASVATGLSISSLASNVTIAGHKPILAGATVSGLFAGCVYTDAKGPKPCASFSLPPPSGSTVTIGGQTVYAAADATTIALAPEAGNGQPGLSISEPQTLVTA
jgi:hypothetical protein